MTTRRQWSDPTITEVGTAEAIRAGGATQADGEYSLEDPIS